jgi:hypothetical protein
MNMVYLFLGWPPLKIHIYRKHLSENIKINHKLQDDERAKDYKHILS